MSCLSYCCGGSGDDHGPAGLPIFLQRLMYVLMGCCLLGESKALEQTEMKQRAGAHRLLSELPRLCLVKGKKALLALTSFANTSTCANREETLDRVRNTTPDNQ